MSFNFRFLITYIIKDFLFFFSFLLANPILKGLILFTI
uniref:Uncharacterized protein n=1 Tax=Manihot esculenta TaxID=3983 RepID=A0A2C9UKT0_MANES